MTTRTRNGVDGSKATYSQGFRSLSREPTEVAHEISLWLSRFCDEHALGAYAAIVSRSRRRVTRTHEYLLRKNGLRSWDEVTELCSAGAIIAAEIADVSSERSWAFVACVLDLGKTISRVAISETLSQRTSFLFLGHHQAHADLKELLGRLNSQAMVDGWDSIDDKRLILLILSSGFIPVRVFDDHNNGRIYVEVYLEYV
jgi:hypothetical protein